MKHKNTALYLDLNPLVGATRTMVSKQTQLALFALGFVNFDTKQPDQTRREHEPYFCVNAYNDEDWKSIMMVSPNLPSRHRNQDQIIFNAATELDAFIAAAQEVIASHKTINITIEGIQCTIKENGVTLDSSALITRVMDESKKIWARHWPEESKAAQEQI